MGVEGLALTLRDVVVRMRFRSGQTVSAVLRAARNLISAQRKRHRAVAHVAMEEEKAQAAAL